MFKVEFHQKTRYWMKFVFKFETLEEAQQFVQSALSHFAKEEDDEDMEDMAVSIEFSQKFTTEEEKENDETD